MKVAASNHSDYLIVGKKMAMESTTVLKFVAKVYLVKLIFRNFDYYTKM